MTAAQIHEVPAAEVHALLHSRPEGLDAARVAAVRREVGANRLHARRRLWWARSLARQLGNFFALLLDVSAAICFVAERVQPGQGMALLGVALLGVSLLNALFGFVQEYRAERAMEALRRLLPQRVRARRDGREVELSADELVPGDVLLLAEGDRVPADARLVEARALLANDAPLTGESTPVTLVDEPVDGPLARAANVAFAGCTILRGSGVGVVFATGFRTEFGRIAALSHEIRRNPSPLERQTSRMVRTLTLIAVAMGVAFFAYGVVTGRPLWINLVFMMGIIVANVPEGLLPTFTLSLAMGSLRMARRNVLVKSLNAVEALGAVHAVCTDKTGTLTENRLAVTVVAGADGEALGAAEEARALERALAASEVEIDADAPRGDPLDVAVHARWRERAGEREAPERLRAFPFDVEKRRSAGVARAGGPVVFAVKGAWEAIRPMLAAGDGAALDAADAAVHALASRGRRVIAVASRELDAVPGDDDAQEPLEHDLVLDALLGLEDPLRPQVPDAVARCHAAGIRVIMITGDHPDTALAVARGAGIVADDTDPAAVVTGEDLARMRERALVERLRTGACVFARTTPEQKMKIVAALHQLDLVVAVTGDGVNDAPALKAADVGIAMGRGGTDVARESAEVILLDDDFASIVAGIEEGRTIFDNIRKFTNYVLVSNGPEIIPYLLYVLLPVPLALPVLHILVIDLGTDVVPSIALGQEPPDADAMRRPPRGRDEGLLDRRLLAHSYGFLGLIEAAFSLALFFWVLHAGGWSYGAPIADDDPLYRSATGIALASIMLMQIGNLVGRRSATRSGLDRGLLANRLIVLGVGVEVAISWAILYVEPVARVIGTGPVDPALYAVAWLGPVAIFALDLGRKRWFASAAP